MLQLGIDIDEPAKKVKFLLDMFSIAQNHRKKRESMWRENYEFYYGWDRTVRKAEHQSKLFVPRPFMMVESKAPRLVMNFITKDPIYMVNPQHDDDIIQAKIQSELLTRQTKQQPNLVRDLTCWVKDSLIYGHGLAKSGWEYCETTRKIRQASTPVINLATQDVTWAQNYSSKRVIEKDNPTLRVVDIGEIYIDPAATCIEDAKFIIHRMLMPSVEAKKKAQYNLYDMNVLLTMGRTNMGAEVDDFMMRRYSTHGFENPFQMQANVYDYIEILECWYVHPVTGEKMLSVLGNRKGLLMDREMPYWHGNWPFYLLNDVPMTGELYGIGEIDPVKPLVRELNSLRNQRMDNLNQILKAFFIVHRGASVDKQKLKNMVPGGILETNMMDGVQILRPPSIDNLTFNAEAKADSDMQITSGINDTVMGTSTRSQFRNATTANMMSEASNIRFALTAMNYAEQMRKVGRDWLGLNNQYMTQPVLIRIFGADGAEVTVTSKPEDISANPDVYVTMGADIQGDKSLKQQQKMQLFSVLANIPGFRITDYAQDIMRDFGEKAPQRYFEGSTVIPAEAILQKFGMQDKPVSSSYLEQQGGIAGGGTQMMEDSGDLMSMAYNAA